MYNHKLNLKEVLIMNLNVTEVVFILDRSGSMSNLVSDTIGGYNSMLEKQKRLSGDVLITTILFDDQYEILYENVNLKEVFNITEKEYYVRGSTALLDAMGKTINYIGKKLENIQEDMRPGKVLFVIITDGYENSSREFNYKKIKSMVEHQKSKYSWEFIFLGANIDAIAVADNLGIADDRAVNYCADSKGTLEGYESINYAINSIRVNKEIDKNWKKNTDEDYQRRNKR
jgi:uncharacterized protein YegL